jgi:hypothetical protein
VALFGVEIARLVVDTSFTELVTMQRNSERRAMERGDVKGLWNYLFLNHVDTLINGGFSLILHAALFT